MADNPILTPEQVALEILAGPIRDYTGLGKGCYCDRDFECGDCAIGRAIAEALRARAAEDAATIARLDREVVNLQIERSQSDRALATLREATTWQPMSTAPKDGRAFLAATRFLGQPCVERIYWDRGWKGAQGEQRFDVWMPLPPCPTLEQLTDDQRVDPTVDLRTLNGWPDGEDVEAFLAATGEQGRLLERAEAAEAEVARLTQERDEARALWDEVGQHIDRAAIGWNHPQIAAVFHENRQKTTLYREALIRAETAEAALATLREAHVEQMRPPRARRPRKVAPDLWAQVPPEILDKMNELLAENSRLKRLYALSRQAMAKCRTCRRRGLRQSPREGTDLQR